LVDGLIKKGKGENQLEVAIGDGMEFTIHGDLKNKGKKNKLMNNTKVSVAYKSLSSMEKLSFAIIARKIAHVRFHAI
jgi:hypothetical protein